MAAQDIIGQAVIPPGSGPDRSLVGRLHRAESLCGLVMAALFVLIVAFGGFAVVYARPGRQPVGETVVLASLLGVAVVAELAFLAWVKGAYDAHEHPLPPRLALRQPEWPVLLRPVIAAWWLAHWIGLVLLAEAGFRLLHDQPRDADIALVVFLWVVKIVFLFGAAFVSNVYLLLIAGALRSRWGLIWGLWRWRFGLDLLIALVVLWLPVLPRR